MKPGPDQTEKRSSDPEVTRARLLSRHRTGAIARSTASVLLFGLAVMVGLIGVMPQENFLGVAGAVLLLLIISLPAVRLAQRLPLRFFPVFSVLVHALELLAYTAVIHFCGGIEATFLIGIYAAMIAYVGVVLPRPWPFRVALGSSAAFSGLVLLEYAGLIDHRPLEPHTHLPPLLQMIFLGATICVLLVVAYLATQGADVIRRAQQRLKEQNRELELATDRAIQSDRLKSEFLANMSHEIRTPLNGVIGMTSLLLSAPLGPDQKEQVETIRASGKALLDVINDVLDLSKVESGVIELDPAPFDVRSCFEDSMAIVSGSAAAKGLEITLVLQDPMPASLVGDQARLRQIIVNLLANAVKFTDKGEVLVRVTVTPEGDLLRMDAAVEDTGPGISSESATRLFRPFVQLDASMTRRFGGTGLGLVISKRLAALMGGDVRYEPRKGGGSVFHLSVALRAASSRPNTSDLAANLARARAEVERQAAVKIPLRVLVVDDNTVNQRVATMMLKLLGYDSDVAADGIEALAAHERQAYDLVLMDVQMPNMDGMAATRAIRARQPRSGSPAPLILGVSAHALSTDRDLCLSAGMDDYLTKPFQLADLKAAITGLVARRPPDPSHQIAGVASDS